MWDKTAAPFVAKGDLVILGVVQEQHAERARLYRQWRQFHWPIAQDAITKLELAAVPIPVLIDEHGIVRNRRPRPGQLAAFVKTKFAAPESSAPVAPFEWATPEYWRSVVDRRDDDDAAARNELADALIHFGRAQDTTEAIETYQKLLEKDSDSGKIHFRLGVAFRKRFDSGSRQPGDFEAAARHWTRAIQINPNQYIWRRRVEQYGPRLIKPYPFYDWIGEAMDEIRDRGEVPVELSVPLTGSEIAEPSRKLDTVANGLSEPDPDRRIDRDTEQLIRIETAVVPAEIEPGGTARVHVVLIPESGEWNNESEGVHVWIGEVQGARVSTRGFELPNPREPESDETRAVDFEIQVNPQAREGSIHGYAIYYACDNGTGQCLYRRQDFQIPLDIGNE